MSGFLVSAGVFVDGGDDASPRRPSPARARPEYSDPGEFATFIPGPAAPGLQAFDAPAPFLRPRPPWRPAPDAPSRLYPQVEDVGPVMAWYDRVGATAPRARPNRFSAEPVQAFPAPADDAVMIAWAVSPAAVLPRRPNRLTTDQSQVLELGYHALSQAWDVPTTGLRARQAARVAPTAAECLGPATIPDDQQQLASWRVDAAAPRWGRRFITTPALNMREGELPLIVDSADAMFRLWDVPAATLSRRPPRFVAEGPFALIQLIDTAAAPAWLPALQEAAGTRAARLRAFRPLEAQPDPGSWLQSVVLAAPVISAGWDVQAPALRTRPFRPLASPGDLVLDVAQAGGVALPWLDDMPAPLLVRARRWGPPSQLDGPPAIAVGVVIVAGPLGLVVGQVYAAGAAAGVVIAD